MEHIARGVGQLAGVDDDDIELVWAVAQVAVGVIDHQLDAGVVQAARRRWEELAADIDDLAIDLDHGHFLHTAVAQHFARHATIAAAEDEHAFRVRHDAQRRMHQAFGVERLIEVRERDGTAKRQHFAEGMAIVDRDPLERRRRTV